MPFDSNRYTHDSDRAALKALKAIPGFSALTKGFMNIWNEPQQKIMNMSTRIRLGENQMSKYYNMLPPICEKLGIAVPELYLELDVIPNAYTYGDNNPFIVMTSGLLETIPDELVPTVLAHECGHIACHHTLYMTMGRMVLSGAANALSYFLRFGGLLSIPLQVAFYYWMRCSEFSADRAAVLCDGTAEKTQEVCMRFAGWDKDIKADVSIDAFLQQAAEYKELVNGKAWNKTLEFMILSQETHPLMAVRATECAEWAKSEEYNRIINGLPPVEKKETKRAEIEESENQTSKDDGQAPFDLLGFLRPKKTDNQSNTMPDNMQVCKIAETGNQIYIPSKFSKVKSMPDDPPRSVSYGLETEGSQVLISVFPRNIDIAMPYDDPQSVVDSIHETLEDSQGLIEVNAGITNNGRKYIYSIVKSLMDENGIPKGVQYCLVMDVDYGNEAVRTMGFFGENGTTGIRDTTVFELLRRDGIVTLTENGASGWNEDPYNPSFTRGALMNRSEDKAYDEIFPLHPLTEARKTVREIIDNN